MISIHHSELIHFAGSPMFPRIAAPRSGPKVILIYCYNLFLIIYFRSFRRAPATKTSRPFKNGWKVACGLQNFGWVLFLICLLSQLHPHRTLKKSFRRQLVYFKANPLKNWENIHGDWSASPWLHSIKQSVQMQMQMQIFLVRQQQAHFSQSSALLHHYWQFLLFCVLFDCRHQNFRRLQNGYQSKTNHLVVTIRDEQTFNRQHNATNVQMRLRPQQ